MKREMLEKQKTVVSVIAAVLILIAAWRILTQVGVLGGPDSLKGYYALQVNNDPNASPDKQAGNMVFGFEKFVLSEDHTFRLGFLRGNWRRSGDSISLEPTSVPSKDQFYAQTTMADALSILLKPTDFKVSADEKTLTAVNPTNGPVVFVKVSEGLR